MLGSVGEPINPEAWRWYYTNIGKERCPIMDTWWQTETGGFMITPTPVVPLKPGSGTLALCRRSGRCRAREWRLVRRRTKMATWCIKHPWPGMARTIWGDPDRYKQTYWSEFAEQGWYFTGDSARKDEDGYFWIIGRMDDVIKVSGYRLGTAEVESALVSHPSVAEAAVIGVPDELRGNVIHAFCILNAGIERQSEPWKTSSRSMCATRLARSPSQRRSNLSTSLPKTRSGKIMRRLLKAQVMGQPVGDTSTLEG